MMSCDGHGTNGSWDSGSSMSFVSWLNVFRPMLEGCVSSWLAVPAGVAMPFVICVCCVASSVVVGWVVLVESMSFGIGRRKVGGTVVLLMNFA